MDGLESEGKKWIIAGVSMRSSVRPINTKTKQKISENDDDESTTPTAEETRIPERLPCPPAPRKQRPPSRCNFDGVREFFTPPDLESVFIPLIERAK